MRSRLFSILALAVIGLAASGNLLMAQTMTMDVAFEFHVGETVMPAGTYEIRFGKDGSSLSIKNVETGEFSLVPYITRVSPREDKKSSVVFDKVNGASYLSEIYFTGMDGFHLQGAPDEHDHSVLKSQD